MSARLRFDNTKFFDAQIARLGREYTGDSANIIGRLTRQTVGELYGYLTPECPWADQTLATIDMSIHEGATSVDWDMMKEDPAPGSSFVADKAPIPFSDVALEGNHNRGHTMKCGFRFDEQEAASAAMTGMQSPSQTKGWAAKAKHDRDLDGGIRLGITGKFTGALNVPGSSQMVAGTTTGTTAAWATAATPDQIRATFEAVWAQVIAASGSTIKPDSVVFPDSVGAVMRAPLMIGNSTTIFKWLQDQFTEIKNWHFDSKQNTAGLGSTACMLMYKREHMVPMMSLRLRPMPMRIDHDTVEQGFRSRYFGIRNPYPKGVAVLSNI